LIRLFYLAVAALTMGFGLGYVKFFLLTTISQDALTDKDWIIQLVGALLTIGPFLIYILAAALASAYQKRYIMLTSGLATALILLLGKQFDWYGSIWAYLFIVGLFTGIFNPAKNAAVPLEALQSGVSTEAINGILNTTYILGLLAGIPAGTEFAKTSSAWGDFILYTSFTVSAIFGYFWYYQKETQHLIPFKQATKDLLIDTKYLFRTYIRFLISSPLLWGIGCAVSLAVVAYAEVKQLGTATECSFMAVYPVIGIISGNLLATYLVRFRTTTVPLACFLMTAAIYEIPQIVKLSEYSFSLQTIYWCMAGLLVVIGFLFGITTNLIEAEYFRRVYNDKREGSGAALLSAGTAFFPAIIGILIAYCLHGRFVSIESQFVFLAFTSLCACIVCSSIFCIKGDSLSMRYLILLVKFILRLRYRLTLSGFDNLQSKVGKSGILFTPNHPAETDPIILCAHIWRLAPVRPVVVERYYYLPIVHSIMRFVRAIPLPDMEQNCGFYSLRRLDAALNQIIQALKNGDNVLFYPSGHIMRSSLERLKGNSGLQKILKQVPEAKVVMVRTRGLRGSLFSAALSGVTPPLFPALRKALKITLQNLIFFMPKRNVSVHFEVAPTPLPINGSVQELNSMFELWYNKEGADEIKLISYSRWKNELLEIQAEKLVTFNTDDFPKSLIEEITRSIASLCDVSLENINLTSHLGSDLGMDSLLIAQLLRKLEEKYSVTDIEIAELQTVASVVAATLGGKKSTQIKDLNPAPKFWTKAERPIPEMPEITSVQDAFIKTARRMRGYAAMADELSGVISWHKLEIAVTLLADVIKKLPNERIGVMMPASCGASIVILAVVMAKKIPVIINWTMGQQGLQHAVNLSNIEQILTAGSFLDKLDLDLGCLEDKFLLLEELKAKLSLPKKLKAVIKSYLPKSAVTPKITDVDSPFAILFTSGSESIPKGVPLSHKNILTNIQDTPHILTPKAENVLLGFLPPFHSFGLMATVFFPLLTGLRIVYHPNPNESRFLAKACKKWNVTLTAGTPTFLRGILESGEPSDFTSLHLLFAGAESIPQALFDLASKFKLQLVSGYGITECSPIVSGNPVGEKVIGVGRPFPHIELLIVHPETHEVLPEGQNGLILIRGDSVFSGYLDKTKNPFLNINGQCWYNSGDLGYLKNGHLVLAGRLKRFTKIGGEMVSLPAIEEALSSLLQQAVVLARETESRPELVLFSTFEISKDEVNKQLREAGFPNLVRIKEIKVIKEIPLLGTGKTDIRTLQTML